VAGFKAPTPHELARDYLWRVHHHVPGKGEIAIFNRSHYEDVLITRVNGWIDAAECKRRYRQINDFERLLAETGTTILKFYLHISKTSRKNAWKSVATPRKSNGNSSRATLRCASSGTITWRPTRRRCPPPARNMRPGT